MLRSAILLWLCTAGILLGAGTKLVDSDFTKTGGALKNDRRSSNHGSFQGVLPLKWSENFADWTKSSAETELVKVPQGDYLRFKVLKVASGAPQFYLALPELLPGKRYRLNVVARNQSENAASLILRMIPPPYNTLRTLKIGVTPQWKTFSQIITLEKKSPVPLGFFLILDGEGTIDFRRITLEELGGGKVLLESDFTETGDMHKNDHRAQNHGSFQGVLPLKWSENYADWTKSSAETEVMKDPQGDYLRFKVLKVASGAPQFYCGLPELLPGKRYRLSVVARNQSENAASLILRMIPPPYNTLRTLKIGVSPQWKTFSQIISLEKKSPVPLGLFLILDGEGNIDFRRITLEELGSDEVVHQVLMETNFVDSTRDCSKRQVGTFQGVLPASWNQDFTHFMKAEATAKVVNLGPEHFLQIEVQKGAPQFSAPLEGIAAGKNYRLTAYLRNRTGGPVKMSLRILPAPYTTLSAGALLPTQEWCRQTIHFKVPENKPNLPVALMMNFEETGILDIVSMKLEESEGASEIVRRPSIALRNYFRNTRFPLGLQSGWTRHRDCHYGVIAPDPSVKGPSGEPALKLESLPGKQIGLCSEPFNVADPKVKNAVSFAYRGNGKFIAGIWSENRQIFAIPLPPSDTWKRISVPFKAPVDSWAFTLRLTGTGTLYVDSFRAAPENRKGYEVDGECEVALAVPKSETSGSRIQFAGEAPVVNYYVSGKADGVTLKSKVTNLYGESRELPAAAVSAAKRNGSLNYQVFPEKPFGQFRVEVQAFRGGKAVSPVNEIVVTRLEKPLYWGKDAPDSPFGVHVLSTDDSLKAVKAAGVNWARLHDAGADYIGWFWLEPEKGKWSFRDDDIQSYRRNHIKLFGQFGTAPKWASWLSKADTGRSYIIYHDRYFQPIHLKDFENYVSKVAARYKGVIDDWFVWNEPWIVAWWGVGYNKNSTENNGYITSKNPQADFAALTKTAYLAAKKVNPNVKVSGFNTTGGGTGEKWTKGVYDAGGLRFCDTVDFHFYTPRTTGYPEDACETAYNEAIGYILKQNGSVGKPVYMSEGQGASGGGVSGDNTMRYAGLYKHTVPWDNREDYTSIADRNVRYLLSMLSHDVKKIFLYSAHCYTDFSNAPNFLVLFCADGSPHPMLVAHSAMARRLEGMKFVRTKELCKGLWAYLFSNGKQSISVISGRYSAKNTKITCSMKNVKAADLYGNPLTLPALYSGTLFYLEAPVAADVLARAVTAGK